MRKYIKKIQSKSEDTRKLIFVGTLILFMSFVSFVWIYSLGQRFGDSKVKEQAREDIKPFKLFTNSISDTYKNLSASAGKSSVVSDVKKEADSVTKKQIELTPVEYTNQ